MIILFKYTYVIYKINIINIYIYMSYKIIQELITPNKRINELKGQYRLMQFKLMLLDYEIKSYNISKMSLAKGLVKYILSFISRPNAIDDALQVIYMHIIEIIIRYFLKILYIYI